MPRTTRWVACAVQLAVLSVLVACRDHPTQSIESPGKIVESLVGCRVEVATGNTQCEPISPQGRSLEQGALDLIEDAQWMVETQAGAYTPADSTYRFNLRVNNDTEATLGTTDGVTATGLKVFLPVRIMGYASRQAGDTSDPYGMLVPPIKNTNNTVQARNPDGVASFTAKDQPYWSYPEILEPGESSGWREWQFTVDPSVSYFYFAVSIFTLAAGEQPMGPRAPLDWIIPEDSVNKIFTETNLIYEHPRISGPYPRDLVMLFFAPGATEDEKRAAVDYVGGTVVGGNGAHYFVRVTNGAEPVFTAIDKLKALPHVKQAIPYLVGIAPTYVRPNNGVGWQRTDWEVHPDSARGDNWAAEAIAAPAAWGCETGISAIKAAVIDIEAPHGRRVASILRSPGNTNSGITGITWGITLIRSDASRGLAKQSDATIKANLTADLRAAIVTERVHVVNISLGVNYFTEPTATTPSKRRLPNPSNPADVAKAQTFADEWRTVLEQIEAETTNRPLYVISAGNYQVDALFSGFPEVARSGSLAKRAIAVVGHSNTRIGKNWPLFANTGVPMEPGSNTGGHIAAPGRPVHIRTDVASDEGFYQGASFAAPHVGGIAALLYSQVPTRDAETVRQYIMEGATRGGRTADGHPIANAYESLKRGAEDRGAPLCGNRVWADGAQIYAQRGSGAPEALGPAETGGQIGDLLTQHGGRVILYNNTARQGRALHRQADGTWQLGTIPADYNAKIGGATWSVRAYSHGADSLVGIATNVVNDNMWWRSYAQANVPVILRTRTASNTILDTTLGFLPIPNVPEPETRVCVERVPNGSCTYTLISGRYWLFRVAFPQAYQPVLVTVTGWYSAFKEPEPWRTCTRDPSLECRNAPSELLWTPSTVYRIPLTGDTPVKVAELPDPVFWIGQTEAPGSDSLVMGTGRWISEYLFNPDTRSQPRTRNEIPNCAIEYRSLATIQTVGQRIANPNVCYWSSFTNPDDHGGGSIVPDRRPSAPNGGTPTAPRTMRIDVGDLLRAGGTRRN